MDYTWEAFSIDVLRRTEVIYHPTATPLELVEQTDSDGIDYSQYTARCTQSDHDVQVTLHWHSELVGENQPQLGRLLEVRVNGLQLFWGIIESINSYTLRSGERSMQLTARSRDGGPLVRNVRRNSEVYPIGTPLSYIARDLVHGIGLTDNEVNLPPTSAYTVHSNTQLADLTIWDMLTQIYLPLGLQPYVDAHGVFKCISRDTGRTPDLILESDRLISVNGSKSQSGVSAVRIKWLDPNLKKVPKQAHMLGQFHITCGFFQLKQRADAWFSEDHTQRAENTYMIIKQSANNDYPLIPSWVDEEYVVVDDFHGRIECTTSAFAPFALIHSIADQIAASFIPDKVASAGAGFTIPWGRLTEALLQAKTMAIMSSIGTGNYEVWGTPYDYAHQRNITEAYDSCGVEWVENVVDIENDFCMDEPMAQQMAVRELIYQARQNTTYGITMVDDPRVEVGDIIELPDETRLYVTGYTRNLDPGAGAVLNVDGFRVL